MADTPTKKPQSQEQEQQGPTQQQLDPLAGGDREAVDAFRTTGKGDASHTAANPPAKDPGARAKDGVDPRASPPFAKG